MSNGLSHALRERVRQIERPAMAAHGVLPFGIAAIDRALPGGGLARGALHEIQGQGGDEEDGALAAAFAAGILGRLGVSSPLRTPLGKAGSAGRPGENRRGLSASPVADGVVLWCSPRRDLYGPGLAARGLDPGRLVLVRARPDAAILWTMEEGLRAAGVAAVVGEIGTLPAVASRRLQLGAEHYGVTAFVLRRWRDGEQAARERNLPNTATTRWRIAALPSRRVAGWPGIGRPCWRIELMRCRAGAPACWDIETGEIEGAKGRMADAADFVSVAAALADRPDAPVRSIPAGKIRHAG
jgi:protein ImuA